MTTAAMTISTQHTIVHSYIPLLPMLSTQHTTAAVTIAALLSATFATNFVAISYSLLLP